MSTPVIVLAVVAAIVVGYWVGRLRPYRSLGDWATNELRLGGRWQSSKAHQCLLAVMWAATCPGDVWAAFRRRNDPPKPVRAPAVRILDPNADQ